MACLLEVENRHATWLLRRYRILAHMCRFCAENHLYWHRAESAQPGRRHGPNPEGGAPRAPWRRGSMAILAACVVALNRRLCLLTPHSTCWAMATATPPWVLRIATLATVMSSGPRFVLLPQKTKRHPGGCLSLVVGMPAGAGAGAGAGASAAGGARHGLRRRERRRPPQRPRVYSTLALARRSSIMALNLACCHCWFCIMASRMRPFDSSKLGARASRTSSTRMT